MDIFARILFLFGAAHYIKMTAQSFIDTGWETTLLNPISFTVILATSAPSGGDQ